MHLDATIEAEGLPDGTLALFSALGDIALRQEGLAGRYQAGLLIVTDARIAEINAEQRGIARATDVLSFPSVWFSGGTAGAQPERLRRELDVQTGCVHLGDIVISLPRASAQACEYRHTLTRELGFLFVHGLLHLMGYDHETDKERMDMRAMEETIMDQFGLTRELTQADMELLAGAREAMQAAYAPYSKYRVGACVRGADGTLSKGCNVENASFGLSLCAERNAMTTAVTGGMREIEAIAIAAEGPMPYPCGACRQFMREFAKDLRVIIANEGTIEVTTLEALLPNSFGPESIREVNA